MKGVDIIVKKLLISISLLNFALCLLYYGCVQKNYNQTDWLAPTISTVLLILEIIRIFLSKSNFVVTSLIHIILVSVLLTQIPKMVLFIELKYYIPILSFILFFLSVFAKIICSIVTMKQKHKENM